MKKGRCFNYKEKGNIILNYLEKVKVFTILGTLNIDDIENLNQRKE